jgi:integrase/recombinase XerD
MGGVGGVMDVATMRVWLGRHLEWLQVHNYSERTVENVASGVDQFLRWCDERALTRPEEITRPILERYQRTLFHYRRPNGRPLTFRTQSIRVSRVRGFFRWLVRQGVLVANPASDLEMPRPEKRLPMHVLTADEAERILALPKQHEVIGLRDRAMLELLYATGLRRNELVGLCVDDVDVARVALMIRLGKGKKDRVVPLGERALAWLQRYVNVARPELETAMSERALFLGVYGERLCRDWITERVRGYIEASKIGKKGACHLFRHTMATLMLEGGADVRYVQEMLGHENIQSTQVYTRVSIQKLRDVHAATHPGARLGPRGEADTTRAAASTEDGEARAMATAELLSSLAAEAADDDVSS